jgi:hypothetical protein
MKQLSDLSAPQDIQRKLLEKDIQSACVAWARKRGYWARKFSSPANRSVPDYLFSLHDVLTGMDRVAKIKFAVEFKAPGKRSTDAQLEEQGYMRDAGWYVLECDNVDRFKVAVLSYENECA